jgi:L-threonylcarbamoyladenylate synthase
MLITSKPEELVDIILQGGIIAYPTEAVFGLGCLANNEASLQRLLSLKKRSADKGLILIASQIEQLAPYIQPLKPEQIEKILKVHDNATTWLVPATLTTSPLLTGKHQTLAVRITSHPPIRQLCQQLDQPLVSTSANLSHQPAALTTQKVKEYFQEDIDGILDAPIGFQPTPSMIIDLKTGRIIRA